MVKVVVVTHCSEAAQLLEAVQAEGILQVLDAKQAMVGKDLPELQGQAHRPRELEDLVSQLSKSIAFLKEHSKEKKALADILAPRTVVGDKLYGDVVSGREALGLLDHCEETAAKITHLHSEYEHHRAALEMLAPWGQLTTPVEEIGQLERAACLLGLIPGTYFERTQAALAELGAVVQEVGRSGSDYACVVVTLREALSDVHKELRAADFQPESFEGMSGTVAELIKQHKDKLKEVSQKLADEYEKAAATSRDKLKLQILYDHHQNLLTREQVRANVPATEHTVLLEGWIKRCDYARLEKIVAGFPASSLSTIEPAEDEQIPVEIDNNRVVRPFEVITRLYGMPQHFEVDPTALLAPFFALFFALCLTDAGYGIFIIAVAALMLKKLQGDKKIMWLLVACSASTLVAGALTGGWFGDAIQQFIPSLAPARQKLMWFDPFEKPMTFFVLALAVGYLQIIVGLIISFVHYLVRRELAAAVCDKLTWLVMLNSLVLLGFSKAGALPVAVGNICVWTTAIPAVAIVLFSQRHGGWVGRIGMGCYQLFSTIFYLGDVLSYLRLMALGMVTAGLAMAINVIAKVAGQVPYFGFVLAILVLVGGHTFNTAISGLSAFVHTLRLQYVEFFPKFLVGGGRSFEPLGKRYKHIYIVKGRA